VRVDEVAAEQERAEGGSAATASQALKLSLVAKVKHTGGNQHAHFLFESFKDELGFLEFAGGKVGVHHHHFDVIALLVEFQQSTIHKIPHPESMLRLSTFPEL
jgi:hypothetical protein